MIRRNQPVVAVTPQTLYGEFGPARALLPATQPLDYGRGRLDEFQLQQEWEEYARARERWLVAELPAAETAGEQHRGAA